MSNFYLQTGLLEIGSDKPLTMFDIVDSLAGKVDGK